MSITLNEVVSPNNTSVMNANFQKIEDAINDDVVKRNIEEGEANELHTHLDMNYNKMVNLEDGVNPRDATTIGQLASATPVKGVDYFDGADGTNGTNGTDGLDGAQGIQGIQGEQGLPGADGADGADGLSANKADFATFIQGAPADAEKLFTIVVPTAFTLPAGLTGSKAYAEVTATAAATFTVSKNGGASLGTIDFAIGTNAATFTFATPTAFAIGDRLQLVNQGTADATLADVSLTIRGDL